MYHREVPHIQPQRLLVTKEVFQAEVQIEPHLGRRTTIPSSRHSACLN